MKVKLWCNLTHGASSFGSIGTLLTREVEMGAIPDANETSCIELYLDPEEHGGGYMASVKRRYWDFDGTPNLELVEIHVDPTGPLLEHFTGRAARSAAPEWHSMCWTTDVDPDPLPLMLQSGWMEY